MAGERLGKIKTVCDSLCMCVCVCEPFIYITTLRTCQNTFGKVLL